MTENKTLRLGEILFAERLIGYNQLVEALETQKSDHRKLGELLVDKGWINHEKLAEVLARIFNLPFIRLAEVTIDEKVLGAISPELMKTYQVLPIALTDHCLTLATSDPLNISAIQEIQYKSGYLISPVMASQKDIEVHLQKYATTIKSLDAMKAVSQSHKNTQSNPIVHLVDSLINKAIEEKVSDIHFEPQHDRMRVRFRIDGVLYEKAPIPKELERNVISRIKIIGGMDVAENRRAQDGRTTIIYNHEEYDIRMSSLPDVLGENLVLRVLSKRFANRSLDSLGLAAPEVTIIKKLLTRPYGLLLVTGPTGAGKTTTLYSMLNQLNQVSKNIISVEDPVEYELAGITQTSSNSFIGYTFANAIRQILRHDPDIIMVGEIRDVETAEMAIRAALTGHLVLSTMHTNSAVGAITRLIEMGIEPFLIGSVVVGVIAQRLVRKVCTSCRKEYSPEADVLQGIGKTISLPAQVTLAHAAGCDKCLKTGYWGRGGIFEILQMDPSIRELILKSTTETDIEQFAISKGMKTLRMAGLQKVLDKVTTMEEIMRVTFVD